MITLHSDLSKDASTEKAKKLMEQVGKSLPEAALRQRDAPEQIGMTMK